MKQLYRTVINGQILESDSLRQLLAQAVAEKRKADRKMKVASGSRSSADSAWKPIATLEAGARGLKKAE